MSTVLYPGSFDPVTNGHLDVAERAARIFDRVIITVACNGEKSPMFTPDERVELLKDACRGYQNIEVVRYDGLLVDALALFHTDAVIRGLRAVSDFEYEFQMALMNRELNAKCETLFMMPSPANSFVSSRLIKEIARCGGSIKAFVPPNAEEAILRKLGKKA